MLGDSGLSMKEIIGRAICVDECPNDSDDFDCRVITPFQGEIDPNSCRFYDSDLEIFYNTKACKCLLLTYHRCGPLLHARCGQYE